jgi:D-alanyl-lipoteichoic acid acyltransferase DltB (MBOAT superfamily)
MLFNSSTFLIFLPIAVGVYFSIPARWRWLWLLLASYVFYAAWKPGYLVLIFISTVVDYCAGLGFEKTDDSRRRRLLLGASLFANLSLLFLFKYYNFFAESVSEVTGDLFGTEAILPQLDVLLPIGISFYTFQTLSYTIDLYRGKRRAERHFGIFALYVSFFPQLVAGPIERSTRLLPQFYQVFDFRYSRVVSGLRLMLWGFFKKLVVADRLALLVDGVYAAPEDQAGLFLVLGTLFFSFQVYCDFSGYSDIAIGSARLMGFDLMQNFRSPYFSRSLTEFWRRWHISLSTWFRDYLYIPLGGNRRSSGRTNVNLLAVFVVAGFWHGADWHFILWGAIHGVILVCERTFRAVNPWKRIRPTRFSMALQTVLCFTVLTASFVVFRANSVGEAFVIFERLPSGWELLGDAKGFFASLPMGVTPAHFLLSLVALALFTVVEFRIRETNFDAWLERMPKAERWFVYYLLVLSIMFLGQFGEQPFIYFQF